MKKCTVISISNQKGGVAKTSTALNLGYALSVEGKKMLLVDLDPQSSLTICFGADKHDTAKTIGGLFEKIISDEQYNINEYIRKNEWREDFDIIPCNIGFIVMEDRLRTEIGGEKTLSNILEPLKSRYDYIIIDTAPSLGLLSVNALAAADGVIITASPQFLSAIGIRNLLKTINKVQKHLNTELKVYGILMTMCDERTKLFGTVSDALKESYSKTIKIFSTRIPVSVKVGEANLNQMSVIEHSPGCKASQAYLELLREVLDCEY